MLIFFKKSVLRAFVQEDGGKKIELKPGFLMEHDKNVRLVHFIAFLYVIHPKN